MAVAGTCSGVVLALGGVWLVLAYGQSLGTTLITTLVIIALAVGGGVSIVSAFFGLVMPRHMHGPWLDPRHWEQMRRRRERWREFRFRMRHGMPMDEDDAEDGPDVGDEGEDGPAPRRARSRRRR